MLSRLSGPPRAFRGVEVPVGAVDEGTIGPSLHPTQGGLFRGRHCGEFGKPAS